MGRRHSVNRLSSKTESSRPFLFLPLLRLCNYNFVAAKETVIGLWADGWNEVVSRARCLSVYEFFLLHSCATWRSIAGGIELPLWNISLYGLVSLANTMIVWWRLLLPPLFSGRSAQIILWKPGWTLDYGYEDRRAYLLALFVTILNPVILSCPFHFCVQIKARKCPYRGQKQWWNYHKE
jgi:hypothetical protein